MCSDDYKAQAIETLPIHMVDAAIRWIEQGLCGEFLFAVASNDLFDAFARADEDNARAMQDWVAWFYNHTPGPCHGSREKAEAWRAQGGLRAMSARVCICRDAYTWAHGYVGKTKVATCPIHGVEGAREADVVDDPNDVPR